MLRKSIQVTISLTRKQCYRTNRRETALCCCLHFRVLYLVTFIVKIQESWKHEVNWSPHFSMHLCIYTSVQWRSYVRGDGGSSPTSVKKLLFKMTKNPVRIFKEWVYLLECTPSADKDLVQVFIYLKINNIVVTRCHILRLKSTKSILAGHGLGAW